MANGYSLGILQMQKDVSGDATPQFKLEPYGAVASLKLAHTPGKIKNDTYDGHSKTVKVKAKVRRTSADTGTTASCAVGAKPAYVEQTVSIANVRRDAIYLEDAWLQLLDSYATQDAGAIADFGQAPFEMMDAIISMANGIIEGVNKDIITLMLANMGVNRRTASAASTALNFNLSATVNNLNEGPNKIFQDFGVNNMKGSPIVLGGGNMEAFMLQQQAKTANASNGIDTRIQANGMDFFRDYNVGALASGGNAANTILTFEKDAVQFVEFMANRGPWFTAKKGTSIFGTIPLPMVSGNQIVPVEFDFQFKSYDCDHDESDGNGGTVTYHKGMNLILTKQFGLYTLPTTAFSASDPLYGNRGSLQYNITNS